MFHKSFMFYLVFFLLYFIAINFYKLKTFVVLPQVLQNYIHKAHIKTKIPRRRKSKIEPKAIATNAIQRAVGNLSLSSRKAWRSVQRQELPALSSAVTVLASLRILFFLSLHSPPFSFVFSLFLLFSY